jgi:hypothetical protein
MSDALIFVLVFAGLFVLRIIAATFVFLWILPRGDRCPNCDAVTLRLESRRVYRFIRSLRRSWCIACGWRGMLRSGDVTTPVVRREPPAVTGPHGRSRRG